MSLYTLALCWEFGTPQLYAFEVIKGNHWNDAERASIGEGENQVSMFTEVFSCLKHTMQLCSAIYEQTDGHLKGRYAVQDT